MGEMGEIYEAFSDPEGAKTLPVGAAYTRGIYQGVPPGENKPRHVNTKR